MSAGSRRKSSIIPAQQIVFQDQVEVINAAQDRLMALEQQLREIVPTWTMARLIAAYQSLRGVSFLVAVTFVAEVGDLARRRLPQPKLVRHDHGIEVRRLAFLRRCDTISAARGEAAGAWHK